MPKHSSHILELARRGAETRYRELLDEIKMLTTWFPHLRDAVDRDELPVNFLMRQGRDKASAMASTEQRRGHRKMSAAARRKISLAQKRRWAKQRKTKTS